jgi:drug/metabolite transporter (DMT)-like permease
MRLRHGQAVALMVLVTLLWATAGVVARHLEQAQSFEVTFWRSFFNFASLTLILHWWQGAGVWRRVREEGWVLWASGACWAVMFTAFMLALTLTTVAEVLVTSAAGPLLTALVASVLAGQRLPARAWLAALLAGAGIGAMFLRQLGEGHWLGSAVAMAVPVAAAFNWTLVHHAQTRGRAVDMVPAVWIGGALSALATLPLSWPLQASIHDLVLLAALGLGQLAIPCVLAVLCARVLSAPEMSLLVLLEVIFGIAMAWAGAGEVPDGNVVLGGSLVMVALLGNEGLAWRERRRRAGPQTPG